VLDDLRADLNLPLTSLAELRKGPLMPSEPYDEDAQRRTLEEIRQVGTALMSWLIDQLSQSENQATIRFAEHHETTDPGMNNSSLPVVSASRIAEMLQPLYHAAIPEVDGWGYRYDYRIASSLVGKSPILVIRSTGSDGHFDAERYPEPRLQKGLFPPAQADRDIVWIDGRFVPAPRLLRQASGDATPRRTHPQVAANARRKHPALAVDRDRKSCCPT